MRKLSVLNDYVFEAGANEERENALTEALIGYNREHAPLWEQNHDAQFQPLPLQLFVLDSGGALIGGLTGRTHSLRAWLETSILWVDEAHRGRGVGRELVKRAEEEARQRGCLYARLSTSTFQAPGFYEKLGYTLYGKLEDCPPGDTSLYYRKNLRLKETA